MDDHAKIDVAGRRKPKPLTKLAASAERVKGFFDDPRAINMLRRNIIVPDL
jgi:hypothetical protein